MTESSAAPPRLRLFVALELPADVRAALVRWREPVLASAGTGALRGVDVDALHVTLCFLGGQPEVAVARILSVCSAVASLPAARLALGEGLWLPRRGPRVLAVGLSDAGGRLAAVQARLSEGLSGSGGWYRPERRPFLPHVTVARVRHGARVRASSELPPSSCLAFTGSRVTLFRSRLSPAGARYEPLGSVELAG